MKKLLLQLVICVVAYGAWATPVTNLTASYKNGQVFALWTNLSSVGVQYNLYRSLTPITLGSQLSAAQNLGWVPDSSAVNKRVTEMSSGVLNFLLIDSLGTPLTLSQGLFVATTVGNGSYYYAVTTTVNGIEDTTIHPGQNSLTTPIIETVAMPRPILQRIKQEKGDKLLYYVQYTSEVTSSIYPKMTTYGSMPFNFSLLETQGSAPHPLKIKLHGGASNFLSDTVGSETISDVWNLGLDDWYPGGSTSWMGYNQNDNMLKSTSTAPTTGEDLILTNRRVAYTIEWALKNLPLDSTKIIVYGPSEGGIGTIYTTSVMPYKLSSTYEYVGMFNLGFSSDPNGNIATDTNGVQRKTLNYLFGSVPNNLLDDEGAQIFNQSNACAMAHTNRDANYPVMFGINGKNDQMVGWYEKVIWYDSANANRLGGFFYWDMRTHGGGSKAWSFNPPFTKYSTAISYPAFANCSANNNPGNGYINSGDSIGTINGELDWKSNLNDSATAWQVYLYVRKDLKTAFGAFPTPDSCTVDVTPRRTQNFKPSHGSTIYYQNMHNGKVVQSGTASYDGNLIVVPQVKVYSDTNTLRLTISPSSEDLETSIPVSVSASKLFMCSGAPDTLSASGASTYVWTANPNYGTLNVGTGPTIIVNPTVTTTYTVTGKNINGIVGTNSIIVTIGAPFSASIASVGPPDFCPGSSVQLTASPNNTSLYAYQWYGNKVKLLGATSPTYTASKAGVAYVVMTDKTNSTCPATSNNLQVSLLPAPTANIDALGSTTFCSGDSVKLVSSTGTNYKFQWYDNSNPITGAVSRIYYAKTSGSYYNLITISGGCSKATPSVPVAVVTCDEPMADVEPITTQPFAVSTIPNPNNGNFNLIYNTGNSSNDKLIIEVVNILGQEVYRQYSQLTEGQYQTQLNLPISLATGCYFLRLVTTNNVITRRLIVAR